MPASSWSGLAIGDRKREKRESGTRAAKGGVGKESGLDAGVELVGDHLLEVVHPIARELELDGHEVVAVRPLAPLHPQGLQ